MNDSATKSNLLENSLISQSKVISNQNIMLTITLVLIVIISIALFITKNIIFGTITSAISFFVAVWELINKIQKRSKL